MGRSSDAAARIRFEPESTENQSRDAGVMEICFWPVDRPAALELGGAYHHAQGKHALRIIPTKSPGDGLPMDFVVKMLLKLLVEWIKTHPTAPFSRFMLKQRGPRTDVGRMNRMQHLSSALALLLWGCLFLGLWLLTAYLVLGLHLLSQDNPVVPVLIFGLPLLAGAV
jgi:hypothetical protein